jgi:hypothetical protein
MKELMYEEINVKKNSGKYEVDMLESLTDNDDKYQKEMTDYINKRKREDNINSKNIINGKVEFISQEPYKKDYKKLYSLVIDKKYLEHIDPGNI